MAFVIRKFLRWARISCLMWMAWAVSAGLWPLEADTRAGKVVLSVVGDERMSSDLRELSEDFQKQQPLTGDALGMLQGAQALVAQFNRALRSRGFYDATINASIDGRPVADASALEALEARPDAESATVDISINTGPRYRIGSLAIRPPGTQQSLPGVDRAELGIAPGDPADAAAIIAAQNKLLDQLRKEGHALAAIKDREVIVDHATREAEVTFVAEPGPLAKMGPVRFTGTEKVDTVWLQRRVPFKEGEPYSPAKVEELRGKLTSLGTFNAVRLKPATELDANGELPIDVELTDRLQRSFGFGLSYETQLGFAVEGFWVHRNLFGQAESLRLSGEVNHIGQGYAILDTGFAFRAAFRKPDWWLSGQDLRLEAAALREVVPAYTRKAATFYGGFDRTFTPRWQARLGLAAEISDITREGLTQSYRLLGLQGTVLYNRANSDLDPTRGYRIEFNVQPWIDTEPGGAFFTILRLTGRHYWDIAEPGRTVLATRASFGTEPSSNINRIPPDKLFYAGGGGSVRGFVYQTAGPLDAWGNPLGGASVVEANIELRQRIGKAFGAVAFVDAGSAYPDYLPNFSQLAPRVGAGVGIRYYTDFGPIRADVGLPLNRRPTDPPFGIYVSLGQAF